MAKKWTKLSKLLREGIDKVAIDELQQFDPVTGRPTQKTYGELAVDQLLMEAARGKEWAISIAFDRSEGKAGIADKVEGGSNTTEERLHDLTRKHLNDISAKALGAAAPAAISAAAPPPAPAQPRKPAAKSAANSAAAAPTRRLLDLPSNRDRNSKAEGREPSLPPINP